MMQNGHVLIWDVPPSKNNNSNNNKQLDIAKDLVKVNLKFCSSSSIYTPEAYGMGYPRVQ
jgi:hypothetical protein